jgi:PST family polysaccharide transporter
MTPSSISPPLNDVKEAARSLLAVGGPYTASLLVGTGIQLLLPFLVLHTLNAESVGHYRAAVSVSAAYSSFLIASISKDYYPRISAASGNPKAMVDIVNQQQYFVLVLGSPVILTGIAVAPYLIPLLFSTEFSPAADVLEWQLIGDLFRLSSWTMSFAILVRCSGVTYFLTELSAGMTTLLTSWIAVRLFGLPGLGISFLITYIVYYVVVWAIVRRDIKLTCTALNKKMLFFAVASALSIHLISWTALSDYKQYIALLLALVLAAVCICSLRNEIWRMRDAKVNNRLSDI